MRYPALLLIALVSAQTQADGFRCGTRLVITGDSAARLSKFCGQPDDTFKAKVGVWEQGRTRQVQVTQWVYQRSGRKNMIVSIHHGRVVRIERE